MAKGDEATALTTCFLPAAAAEGAAEVYKFVILLGCRAANMRISSSEGNSGPSTSVLPRFCCRLVLSPLRHERRHIVGGRGQGAQYYFWFRTDPAAERGLPRVTWFFTPARPPPKKERFSSWSTQLYFLFPSALLHCAHIMHHVHSMLPYRSSVYLRKAPVSHATPAHRRLAMRSFVTG